MDDYLKMAFEMVKAQATTRPMTTTEMMAMAQELAAGMKALSAGGCEAAAAPETAAPSVVDAKKSIKEKSVTCLVCGRSMKLLTAKHLASHDLDKKSYLEKFGLKKGTALAAKGLTRARKEKMLSMELWKRKGAGKAAGAVAKAAAPKKAIAKKAPKAAAKPE